MVGDEVETINQTIIPACLIEVDHIGQYGKENFDAYDLEDGEGRQRLVERRRRRRRRRRKRRRQRKACKLGNITHWNGNDEPNGDAGPDGDGGLLVMGIGEYGRVLQGPVSYIECHVSRSMRRRSISSSP